MDQWLVRKNELTMSTRKRDKLAEFRPFSACDIFAKVPQSCLKLIVYTILQYKS